MTNLNNHTDIDLLGNANGANGIGGQNSNTLAVPQTSVFEKKKPKFKKLTLNYSEKKQKRAKRKNDNGDKDSQKGSTKE